MTGGGRHTIWALVAEAADTLPEPFSRAALISWISKRRTDVELSSISTHIQYAIAETPNREGHNLGSREPLLERVDRGLYRRYRGGSVTAGPVDVPAGSPANAPSTPSSAPDAGTSLAGVVLVGCSSRKAVGAMPARDLFQGVGFRRARDRALRLQVPWFVLSAKYGLLDPDDVVGPYDVYLGDQPVAYRTAWGEWVVAQLALRIPLRGVTVELHAGDAYCAPLRVALQKLGANVSEPLQGLSQGQRLAWPGYQATSISTPHDPVVTPDWHVLLDPASAVTPAEFLRAGSDGREMPGLYTWWVDQSGAGDLAAGLGHPLPTGLIYAGKAGGHRVNAAPSTSTLWSRVAGNHLRGNIGSSTFRRSLAALLAPAAGPVAEEELTRWMHAHLRVAVLPVPSEVVAETEDMLVALADPPLNLAGAPRHPGRFALTRLRGLLSRPSPPGTETAVTSPSVNSPVAVSAFERRVRADLGAMLAAGYRPTIFQRMLAESGAVGTARRLLAASSLSDGFRYLWEHGLLRHSIESAVLADEFAQLFTDDEKNIARQRLADAGYL